MKTTKRIAVMCMFLLIAGLSTASSAAQYYLSPNGDDANGDGSIDGPWRTLARIEVKIGDSTIRCGDTIYVRGGTYVEAEDSVRITKVCNAGNPLTIRAYPGETPIFQTSGRLHSDTRVVFYILGQYIILDGLQIRPVASQPNAHSAILNSGHHNVYRNLWIESSTREDGTYTFKRGISVWGEHNEIDSSTLKKFGDPTIPAGHNGYALIIFGNYAYVHDNHVERGVHDNLALYGSDYSRIINNTVRNAIGYGILTQPDSDHNLFQGNDIQGAGLDLNYNKTAYSIKGSYNIIRYNYAWGGAGGSGMGLDQYQGNYNRFYNNVIWGAPASGMKLAYSSTADHNVFLNNVIAHNMEDVAWNGYYSEIADVSNLNSTNSFYDESHNNQFRHNYIVSYVDNLWQNDYTNVYERIGQNKGSVSYMEANYTTWSNNIYVYCDPRLNDPGNGDFKLRDGSCLIDAGRGLAQARSSGLNDTALIVDDALWFWQGDKITIGETTTRTILAVNYDTNTLTLDSPVTWGEGDRVTLPYNGSAPDIGAFEYLEASTPPGTPSGLSLQSQ